MKPHTNNIVKIYIQPVLSQVDDFATFYIKSRSSFKIFYFLESRKYSPKIYLSK